MSISRRAIPAVALVLVAVASTSCAPLLALATGNFIRPTLTVRNVDVTNASFDGLSANFLFDVQNANDFALDLGRLDYDLTVDGHQFAQGHANQPLNVPGNGTGSLTLPVSIRFVEMAQSLESLFRKRELPYSIHVVIGFNSPVGVIEVPVDHSGTFPVPQLPSVHLAGASLGQMSFSGASLDVGVDLGNPNAFALPLGTFDYHVMVDGHDVGGGGIPAPTLSAGAHQTIQLPLRVDFMQTGTALLQVLQSGRARIGIRGGLHLGIGNTTLPFSEETTVDLGSR